MRSRYDLLSKGRAAMLLRIARAAEGGVPFIASQLERGTLEHLQRIGYVTRAERSIALTVAGERALAKFQQARQPRTDPLTRAMMIRN